MSENYTTTTSVNEAALKYANDMAAKINQSVAEVAGIDVLWFRLNPDLRNQDVIFQTYTLYGVEDCPLEIKAIYNNASGYDDAILTYNLMNIEYQVPLTLEVPVNTWYEATNYDGTLPQRGDIVYIPVSHKLVEIVSMTPIKAIMAQTTSFKVNCSVYKPTRSRIVGENLKDSIKNNTVNLDSVFGEDIENAIKDIIDDNQSSMFNSTGQDKHKDVTITTNPEENSSIRKVYNVIPEKITVDGHDIARSYYNMNISKDIVVRYKDSSDTVSKDDTRCISLWVNGNLYRGEEKNVKNITYKTESIYTYITMTGKPYGVELGDDIILKRGNVMIYGTVDSLSPFTIKTTKSTLTELNEMSSKWNIMPGYTACKCNRINLMSATGTDEMSVDMIGGSVILVTINGNTTQCRMTSQIDENKWVGIIINICERMSVDVFSSNNIRKIAFRNDIKVKDWGDLSFENYYIKKSDCKMTNIRVYKTECREVDEQIEDLLSYNVKRNNLCIVNDSADIFLDKEYIGQQR